MNTIDRSIAKLTLPSVVSNITVPLLGLIDLTIVGHLGQSEQIGAIAIGGTVFNIIYWIFVFLRMGTTGLTGQAHGSRNKAECACVLFRSVVTALCIAAVICLLQTPLLRMATYIMTPSASVLPYFSAYFNICIWGAPAMMLNYALSGWFIGMQNTRIPMLVAITQNILNIILSICFVYKLHWGLEGVAAGTVSGLYGGLLISLLFAIRLWRKNKLNLPDIGSALSITKMKRFLSINTDILLRTVCMVCVMSFFTHAGSRQNDDILGANALLMEFFILYSYFMDGLANAGEALSAEYQGAADRTMLSSTIRQLFRWATIIAIVFTFTYILFGLQFLHIMTDHTIIILTANHYLPWVWAIPLFSMMAFIWDGLFIGLCWTRGMLISCFIATIVFFTIYTLTINHIGNNALWCAFVLYLLTRGIVQCVYYKRQQQTTEMT